MTLRNWADSLQIDFPADNVPILLGEPHWKRWGDRLLECPSFSDNDIPKPKDFSEWNTWAQRVFQYMG